MRVIDYCGPSWQNLRGDTRMTRGAMMEYMELFWTRVHETQAPAVHRASFKASTAPTPLLLSMMLLGCYFSSLEAYKLACQLHSGFRGKVLCSNDFRPRAELWLHQTILLIVIFGKLCSTRMDHEMSHIFWSSCVTLGRRSAIFSQRAPAVFAPGHDDIETQWAAWIEEEVAKRIALIVFGVDVEHAAFFRHSPTLSAFQIQLQLPCDEELWEARDAQEWARLRVNARPPIPFISALKASLMAGHAPPALNPFSRIAILHGLLSVAQDLQWRDHVIGMSQPEGRANNWRDMISASYNSWKSRLDTCLVTATFPTSQLLRASISLYAIAHITLSIDIHELQIYAGAESALGLVVSAAIYNATEARIKLWSQTKDARAACWHAAFFLRSSLQHYQQSTVDLAGCLHHRWSVFIATLTLYCYGRSTSGEPGPRSENYQEGAMRYLDTMCTNSPEGLLAVEGKNNTLDLCQTICEYVQASRWEIAQEGARILKVLLTKNPSPPKA
ncbi:fungal-specific transcription factor domain-domain-containing protein [Leucosporidium creatinivorum]|uniref:Fungal-specific transcription factor domain-domain-containing protein n=1 Tax=Leucosporidium creatinivorum TaxID=106004 RepID=A0A1Y2FZ80_9BASI|nr:fungal-specific transcription factor domain-domain-containing protein [Leucosporidium creatinivorum]